MQVVDANGNMFGYDNLDVIGINGRPKTIGGGGGVTSVSGTAPISSSGGLTPTISITKASSIVDGYLSFTDWNTFNQKQDAITLTTTGTSGAATLVGATLNIPQYSGGGGGVFGTHIVVRPQPGVYYSSNPFTGSGGTTSTLANNIYLAPFIPKNSISVNEFRVEVLSAAVGGLARIILFDDLNGLPKNKIIESTNLDCSTTGMKTFTASFSFVAGTTYWLGVSVNANIGFRSNNTAFALQHHASSSAVNPQYQQAQTFGSLPSSITISPNSNAFSGQPITIRFRAV
jgi:hypothetical protein